MKYEEFSTAVKRSGLSMRDFARLLGMNPRSITNKSGQKVPRHWGVIAQLVLELARKGEMPARIVDRFGVGLDEQWPKSVGTTGRFRGFRRDKTAGQLHLWEVDLHLKTSAGRPRGAAGALELVKEGVQNSMSGKSPVALSSSE